MLQVELVSDLSFSVSMKKKKKMRAHNLPENILKAAQRHRPFRECKLRDSEIRLMRRRHINLHRNSITVRKSQR